MTAGQEWALSYAIHHGGWLISGRGGMTAARGIEKRGFGTVERRATGGTLVMMLEATEAGRAYARKHRLSVA